MAVPDSEREPSDRDNTPLDPEAELILDYLSNNLPPAQVALVEQRARTEPDFRAKLADIVLIRGLVFLALNKPKPDALKDLPKSDPAVRRARNCELMQVQLYRYIHDETDAATTAEVSRHLDACEDCRDTYEAMRLSADVPPDDVSDSASIISSAVGSASSGS